MVPSQQWILIDFDCLVPAHYEKARLPAVAADPVGRAVKFVVRLCSRLLSKICRVIGCLSAGRYRGGIKVRAKVERLHSGNLPSVPPAGLRQRDIAVEVVTLKKQILV